MHEVDELALFLSPGQSGSSQVTVPGSRAVHESVAGPWLFPVPPGAGVTAGHQEGLCDGGLAAGAPGGGADKPGVEGKGVLAGEDDLALKVEGRGVLHCQGGQGKEQEKGPGTHGLELGGGTDVKS